LAASKRIVNGTTAAGAIEIRRLHIGFEAEQEIADLPVVAALDPGNEAGGIDSLGASRSDGRRARRADIAVAVGRSALIVLSNRSACGETGVEASPIVWR